MLCSGAGRGSLSDEESRVGSGPERRDPDPGECRRQAALGAPWAKRGSRAREGDVLRLALGPGTHTEQSEKLPWAGHGQAGRLGLCQAPDKGRGIRSADRTRVGQPGPTAQSPSCGQRDQDRPLINTSRVPLASHPERSMCRSVLASGSSWDRLSRLDTLPT